MRSSRGNRICSTCINCLKESALPAKAVMFDTPHEHSGDVNQRDERDGHAHDLGLDAGRDGEREVHRTASACVQHGQCGGPGGGEGREVEEPDPMPLKPAVGG